MRKEQVKLEAIVENYYGSGGIMEKIEAGLKLIFYNGFKVYLFFPH